MKTISLTQGQFAVVDDDVFDELMLRRVVEQEPQRLGGAHQLGQENCLPGLFRNRSRSSTRIRRRRLFTRSRTFHTEFPTRWVTLDPTGFPWYIQPMPLPHGRTVLLRVGSQGEQILGGRSAMGQWIYVSGNALSGYSGSFAAASNVIVNHNLGRYPAGVTVRTLGGIEVEVSIQHLNNNQLLLQFDVPTAGTIEIV